jgi:hypothetical protein
MSRRLLVLVAFLAQSTACEFIPSAYPYYREDDVLFDTRLLGEWGEPKEGEEQAATDVFKFEKSCDRARDIYDVTYVSEGKSTEFEVRAFALGELRFLDALPKFDPESFDDLLLIRGHALARADVSAERLALALTDISWLSAHLSAHPESLAHIPGREAFLVADTAALQQFILAHQAEFFDEVGELRRLSPPSDEPVISCGAGPLGTPAFEPAIRALLAPEEEIAFASFGQIDGAGTTGVLVATRASLLVAGWDLRTGKFRELSRTSWSEFACAEADPPFGSSLRLYAPFPLPRRLGISFLEPTARQESDDAARAALPKVQERLASRSAECPLDLGSEPLAEPRAGLVLPGRAGDLPRARAFRDSAGLSATYGVLATLEVRLSRKGTPPADASEEARSWGRVFNAEEVVSEPRQESLRVGSSERPAVVFRITSADHGRWYTRVDLGDWFLAVMDRDPTSPETSDRTRDFLSQIEFTGEANVTAPAP